MRRAAARLIVIPNLPEILPRASLLAASLSDPLPDGMIPPNHFRGLFKGENQMLRLHRIVHRGCGMAFQLGHKSTNPTIVAAPGRVAGGVELRDPCEEWGADILARTTERVPVGRVLARWALCCVAAVGMIIAVRTPAAADCASFQDPFFTWYRLLSNNISCGGTAIGTQATAIGGSAAAGGIAATAYGDTAQANGFQASALGANSSATGLNATATGAGSTATGATASAFGQGSSAIGDGTTAIGQASNASAANATAIGQASNASERGTAIGQGTIAGVTSFAGGHSANASGLSSVAIGTFSTASGAGSVALGFGATDGGVSRVVSVGAPQAERRITNVAAGIDPTDALNVSQLRSVGGIVGNNTSRLGAPIASGNDAHAVGFGATATGDRSAAFGTQASASGVSSVAHGDSAQASGSLSAAIGANAVATAPNAVALGAGSVASAPNTVSVGAPGAERRITNVAAGINPTDAVNVGQLNAVSGQIVSVQQEARRGIAAAIAASGYMTPSAPGRTTLQVSSGFFGGETAVALTAAHRLNLSVPVVLFGSYANGGGSEHVGKVGAGFEF
jgi:hypothetical protein